MVAALGAQVAKEELAMECDYEAEAVAQRRMKATPHLLLTLCPANLPVVSKQSAWVSKSCNLLLVKVGL